MALFLRVEHFNPSLLRRAVGDVSKQFDSSNVWIIAYEARMGRNRSVHVDPIIALTLDAARRSLQILSEAFFMVNSLRCII